MDVLGLLREVSGLGIDSVIVGAVILLAARYWMSEMRRDISKEIDDKNATLKTDLEQSIRENRQEIASFRTSVEGSFSETRQEITDLRTESRQELDAFRIETRQEFNAASTKSEQAQRETREELKHILFHLIDVRERLANIEGRLGEPTPRLKGVSPPLEAPAEEPAAQS